MFSLRKKRRDFQNLYDFLPLPFKVSWDKLFGNLEFDSVSRLSLSKAWFSWEILCQVSVFRARTKLPATSYYLECSDRSDRFRRCCNAVEVSYCHDSHRKNRFPYKISLKRYLPNDLYHLNYHVEELYLKLILCLYQFYCYLQLLQFLASFWVLVKSQIVCSYMNGKVIKVAFQWRFDVCHHTFCCRSAENSCNNLDFFVLLFLSVMSEVYFFF